ncbi:MAG: diacylglycerol kinase family protein [Anaerolineaceae bacterium]|jgi:diacylglycerol kinase (ATP)
MSKSNKTKLKLIHFITTRLHSFKFAFDGLSYVMRTQQNAWIHLAATTLTIIVCTWLKISRDDWISIFLVIGMVWTAEFLNTALEIIVDLASPEKHPLAKIGKDVGAASVLITAFIAIVIGLIIVGPYLGKKFGF